MMRPKIEWLCSGQRSDYHCDSISANDSLYFYAFNYHGVGRTYIDNTANGSGEKVAYCQVNSSLSAENNAGWVVKSLRANTEQCCPDGYYKSDNETFWYVKSKIRIDPSIANGTTNPLVCRIDIVHQNWSRDIIIIRARNFVNGDLYDGRYIEEFNFGATNRLKFKRALGDDSFFAARGGSI